jgi:hypothetical protein
MKAGDRVTVLPSAFGRDSWSGPATVLEICPIDSSEVLVEIGGREVWLNVQRLEVIR